MKCAFDIRYFRVEALVTQRSPHRPVREDFPHTVPRFQFFSPNWKPNKRIPCLAHNFAVLLALQFPGFLLIWVVISVYLP